METILETERLLIRKLMPQDADDMFVMDSDPEVHKYVGQQPVTDIAQIQNVIASVRRQYIDNGIGRWAIIYKETGRFIGWVGFKFFKEQINGHANFHDFGYRLTRSVWGNGLATEASIATLDYGSRVLKINPLFAMTHPANAVSRHILEKVGFLYVHDFIYDGPDSLRTQEEPSVTWYQWKGNH